MWADDALVHGLGACDVSGVYQRTRAETGMPSAVIRADRRDGGEVETIEGLAPRTARYN
jgi:hypothetical protein